MAFYACLLTTVCFTLEGKRLPDAIGYLFIFTLAGLFAI